MTTLPKSKEQYLEEIRDIKRDSYGETRTLVAMVALLVEAVIDLKEAVEIPYSVETTSIPEVISTGDKF